MELDRSLLQKIKELEDDKLAAAIGNIAAQFGLDPKMTDYYLSDMKQIKETVAGLTQEKMDRISAAIGEDNCEKVMDHLRREVE